MHTLPTPESTGCPSDILNRLATAIRSAWIWARSVWRWKGISYYSKDDCMDGWMDGGGDRVYKGWVETRNKKD